MRAFSEDVVKIVTMKTDLAPDPKDKRFLDKTWQTNPFYKAGMQYYLAVQKGTSAWMKDLKLDELERARANFVVQMLLDSMAPSNTLLGNPSAIKRAFDTGGVSLVKGLKNAYTDITENDGLVSQVDTRPFKLGENVANSKGAVVYKTEMMELIQYTPTTEKVHAIPQLTVPPQINKAYINDLNSQLAPILGSVIGSSNVQVLRSDSCGRSDGRLCESRVGNVVADSLRSAYATDFAITNSGGLRDALTCPHTIIMGNLGELLALFEVHDMAIAFQKAQESGRVFMCRRCQCLL